MHEHNKSLLYSNKPKFKEDIRDTIYVDRIRNDGIYFEPIEDEHLNVVLSEIRQNARREFFRQLKMAGISIFLTAMFLLYLKEHLDDRF